MASLMITGGKLGQIIGRKRAFAIGCVIYACGSLTTSLAPQPDGADHRLVVPRGLGAALIMPAIVALVAANFGRSERPRAYGLVAAAGAIAVAARPADRRRVHDLRLVAVGVRRRGVHRARDPRCCRRIDDTPGREGRPARPRRDRAVGARPRPRRVSACCKSGLLGLRAAEARGARVARAVAGDLAGPRAAASCCGLFLAWENRRIERGEAALIDPRCCENRPLRSGVISFFFQYLVQAGHVLRRAAVPVGRARAVGDRDRRPAAAALAHAAAVRRRRAEAAPRTPRRAGWCGSASSRCSPAWWCWSGCSTSAPGAEIVTWPLLLAGLGIGALASQLGSVTVSAVPDEQSGEVGGLQNTGTQLGASIGTALAGAVLISALTTSFFTGIENNPDVPDERRLAGPDRARRRGPVRLRRRPQKPRSTTRDVPRPTADADRRRERAEPDRRSPRRVAILAIVALVALVFTRGIPVIQPGNQSKPAAVT